MTVICPYCETEQEVNHDDWQNYQEDEHTETTCSECEKEFICTTSISYYHEWLKADCLNWSPHKFEQIHWSPKEWYIWRFRCKDCDKEEYRDEPWRKKALNKYREELENAR